MTVIGKYLGVPTLKHVFDEMWRRLVPPRIEMLTWFILMGGLNTKDVLVRRNIIPDGEDMCVLCTTEKETAWWACCLYNSANGRYLIGYATNEKEEFWMLDEELGLHRLNTSNRGVGGATWRYRRIQDGHSGAVKPCNVAKRMKVQAWSGNVFVWVLYG
ncbi:hypothetical protein PIB30_013186 [Stylosanthes scabra]|uniref:Reverse transcriptase zinc-binding domain-containing protein n=1 Tax=Stylosanthes scabra TaxID=79078 RepID=A0ABU6Z5D3_9FABA|nr:hypothetical protein [Stylosanthes scabra]